MAKESWSVKLLNLLSKILVIDVSGEHENQWARFSRRFVGARAAN